MINFDSRIKTITGLLNDGTITSLTYAALECRLSIELICYERLLIAYDYISYDDLRKWQPKDVVQQIMDEANDITASTFSVEISTTPINPECSPQTQEDYENLEYQKLGKQAGFELKELGRLWQSLSNVALHVQLPKFKNSLLTPYGELTKIRTQVEKGVSLLRKIAEGNLLAGSWGPEVSIECYGCKNPIKRKVHLVRDGTIANCVNPSCKESYVLCVNDGEIEFARRVLSVPCDGCGQALEILQKVVDELRAGQVFTAHCDNCGHATYIQLRPCKAVVRDLGGSNLNF
jgi:hypothetical protein